jgi:folate-dependent phosphoribosylglycinamide formyltransferase PurN
VDRGWTSSYPETTGYIIPTFLALARELRDRRFEDRAARGVDFLLRLQLPDGAFPAGEIHEGTGRPSVFNTAQILGGLVAWHASTRDSRALAAAHRAADWLVSVQDADGAWRRQVYRGVPASYHAHASCWLAEFADYSGMSSYREAAARHLEWVLRHHDSQSGWFDLAGFTAEEHAARRAVTHTIAYTLWGVLRTSEILGRGDGAAAVERAARAIARRLQLVGRLPGVLDHRWRGHAEYACLTGNAQMALVWLRLYRRQGDAGFLNAALKALDLVKRAQPMHARSGSIRGGIPGSDPIWGEYLYNALPNWAAKFFIDGLLEKRRVLEGVLARSRGTWKVPGDVPRALPPLPPEEPGRPLRVVLYANPVSYKVAEMTTAWAAWGFEPTTVVVERGTGTSVLDRVALKIREEGVRAVARYALARLLSWLRRTRGTAPASSWPDPITFCRRHNIPVLEVARLDAPSATALVQALQPDLAIHAGAGILRPSVLSIPRLGTLNAHMGILPQYRGMNVTEWARFNGDPVGCTVHLIDPGIDTGDILCVRAVNVNDAINIPQLRTLVNQAQIELLGEVVRFIVRSGALPPHRGQHPEEGVQFFRMHPDLARVLETELRDGARAFGHSSPRVSVPASTAASAPR